MLLCAGAAACDGWPPPERPYRGVRGACARARRRRRGGARRVRVVLFIGGARLRARARRADASLSAARPMCRVRRPLQLSGRLCSAPAARRLYRCGVCRTDESGAACGRHPTPTHGRRPAPSVELTYRGAACSRTFGPTRVPLPTRQRDELPGVDTLGVWGCCVCVLRGGRGR